MYNPRRQPPSIGRSLPSGAARPRGLTRTVIAAIVVFVVLLLVALAVFFTTSSGSKCIATGSEGCNEAQCCSQGVVCMANRCKQKLDNLGDDCSNSNETACTGGMECVDGNCQRRVQLSEDCGDHLICPEGTICTGGETVRTATCRKPWNNQLFWKGGHYPDRAGVDTIGPDWFGKPEVLTADGDNRTYYCAGEGEVETSIGVCAPFRQLGGSDSKCKPLLPEAPPGLPPEIIQDTADSAATKQDLGVGDLAAFPASKDGCLALGALVPSTFISYVEATGECYLSVAYEADGTTPEPTAECWVRQEADAAGN